MAKKTKKPSVILAESLGLLGNGKTWIKHDEYVAPGEDQKYPQGAYCAIGAISKINTKNMNKAIAYLSFAISMDNNVDYGYLGDDIITEANDRNKTKFTHVKRWFEKAIKLAEAIGE